MRLFISYAHKDRALVDRLVDVLRKGGQEVWIDDDIHVGDVWSETLRNSIANVDAIVLAITQNWIDSSACQWEFITASELNKKFVPVLLDPTNLPKRISQYQYTDFTAGFVDQQKVQNFLDDLMILAKSIPKDALPNESKADLEKAAEQEIRVGNVSASTLRARQTRGQRGGAASVQRFEARDITQSTVNIHQGGGRNWPVFVALFVILIVIAIAVIIGTLPETQRDDLLYNLHMIPASATALPTATPTLLPTGTATPTPERLRSDQFNVVVAGFGFQNTDGKIEQSSLADDMSDVVAGQLNQITQIDNTLGWRSNGVGRILGQTSAERETEAAQIADLLNADVVVYGVVSTDGLYNSFEPEFYITAEFAALEPELIGADSLGTPVAFVGNSDDQILAANQFQQRLTVLRYFLRGLAFYLAGNFTGAVDSFDSALEVESSGLEVLDVFAGNAAIRIPDSDRALGYYDAALKTRPDFARALIGRGIALYRKAIDVAGTKPPPYDASLESDTPQQCRDLIHELPTRAQLLGELALRCNQEAAVSSDKPATADIDVKVAFGIGQTALWLSINHYGDYWDEVQTNLMLVTQLYDTSDPARQARIRAAAAHAHAWLGLRMVSLNGSDRSSVCEASNNYRTALALLRLDVNRDYNQRWIDLYGQQVAALDDWLSQRNFSCSASTSSITQTPIAAATSET